MPNLQDLHNVVNEVVKVICTVGGIGLGMLALYALLENLMD